MGKIKRKTQIVEALNSLNKTDIYSLMLFTLYKLHDDPEYTTLTELIYLLDRDSLAKFFKMYEGMTIKVPKTREIRLILQALCLFQYVNLEKGTYEEGLKGVLDDDFTEDEINTVYKKLVDVVANYDFKRD